MGILFEKAVAGFRLSNEAEGLSPKTTKWYDANIKYFIRWVNKELPKPILIEHITAQQIRAYLNELRTEGHSYTEHPFRNPTDKSVSPRTVQAYFSSLSAFFNWAVREELLDSSPMRNMARPKAPKFLPDPFSEDELRRLFSATKQYDDAKGSRISAIMATLLDTAVRMEELLSIQMENVDMEQGRIKVMGKGAKERWVYFGKNTKRTLWRYISMFRPEPSPKINNLFLVQDGRPIPQRRLAHMLTEIGKSAKVENVHPHRWRRTAAIQFLRNSSGDALALQKMLGHTSLDMTKRYLELSDEDLAKAHKNASPVDNLRLSK